EAAAKRAFAETFDPLGGLDRYRLVMVDGFLCEALSDLKALSAAGVELASLAMLLSNDDAMSETMLTHALLATDDIALSLNTAFATDGVAIRIKPGALVDKPVEIAHVST